MSYDLNIIVLSQKTPATIPFKSSIDIENIKRGTSRYKDMWSFMALTKGVWYCLGKKDEGWFDAFSIIDADFDACLEDKLLPYWVIDDDVKSNLKPLVVYEKYKEDFDKILKFLLEQSPDKTMMFMARYQGGEHEIICGVLTLEEFKALLNQSKILFNTCYIIKG